MTKRKRTPSPSPPPRKRVIFEVPQSLWNFQAIARELARQSELLVQHTEQAHNQQLSDLQRPAPGAPLFDAQTFQSSALRFSPYSHQPFLPSQPWPQAVKSAAASPDFDSYATGSAPLAVPRSEGARQELDVRQTSAGPDDQLFEELNDALHANEDDGDANVSNAHSQYVTGTNRITFNPHPSGDWPGMRPDQYQSFIQNYQQMTTPASQSGFASSTTTMAHHPPRTSSINNNFLPNSSPNPQPQPAPPSFYHAKPLPPPNSAQANPSIPGYYKSSLKLWSQEDHQNAPRASPPQPMPHFASPNNAYPHVAYSGNTNYRPPVPPPLASSPVTAYGNYGNSR